jgi:hypothetical protein
MNAEVAGAIFVIRAVHDVRANAAVVELAPNVFVFARNSQAVGIIAKWESVILIMQRQCKKQQALYVSPSFHLTKNTAQYDLPCKENKRIAVFQTLRTESRGSRYRGEFLSIQLSCESFHRYCPQ